MLSMCRRWAAFQKSYDKTLVEIWAAFEAIAQGLHKRGFLPDDVPFVLHHGDLKPWNLLVQVFDDGSVELSGVVDWDNAHIAPKCISVVPTWL
jgi:aminoglycoside phosphotransferase (APT) family kinase protein